MANTDFEFESLNEFDIDNDTEAEEEDFIPADFLASMAALAKSAKSLDTLASQKIADDVIAKVSGYGGEFIQNRREGFSDPNSASPRRDLMQDQLKQALSGIKDASKGAARSALLEAIFDLGILPANERDTLFAHLYHALQEETLPETLTKVPQAQIDDLVSKWGDTTDSAYWQILSDYYSVRSTTAAEIYDHLALLELTSRMAPPLKDPWIWDSAEDIAICVDNLLAASDPGIGGSGTIDVSEMYYYASLLPIPRAIMAEIVRLGLGFIAVGAKKGPRLESLPDPFTLLRALAPEDAAASPGSPTEIAARNALRQSAVELLRNNLPTDVQATLVPSLRDVVYGSQARALKGSLGQIYDFWLQDLSYGLERKFPNDTTARRLGYLLKYSRVGESLQEWSKLYYSQSPTPDSLNQALQAATGSIKTLLASFRPNTPLINDTAVQHVEAIAYPLRAVALEICAQCHSYLSGAPSGSLGQLEGTLAFIECTGRLGELRVGAKLALKDPKIVATGQNKGRSVLTLFLDRACKAQGQWFSDLKSALDDWRGKASKGIPELAISTGKLISVCKSISSSQIQSNAADPFESYSATEMLEVVLPAISDHLQGLIETKNPNAMASLPDLVSQLVRLRPLGHSYADAKTYWSNQSNFLLDDDPMKQHLSTALEEWDEALNDSTEDQAMLSEIAFKICTAINDCSQRVQMKKTTELSAKNKKQLLTALGIVAFNVEEALRARLGN